MPGPSPSWNLPFEVGTPAQPPNMNAPVRKTKLVCTVGPATCSRDNLFKLADAGMAVARLNMSHGSHDSHREVIDLVKVRDNTQATLRGAGFVVTVLSVQRIRYARPNKDVHCKFMLCCT